MKLATASLAVFACAIAAVVACSGDSTSGDDDSAAGSGSGGEAGSSGSAGTSTGGRGGTGSGGRASGGTTSNGGTTSAGGTTTGGIGGTFGGHSGTGPLGGAGMSTGGTSGTPNGGVGGEGGVSGGGGRECETAADCRLFADCCNCMGVPEEFDPPGCDLVCIQSRCMADQIGPDEVTCSFGRCVIDRSCNYEEVTCNGMPEACPDGQVRSVTENGCWGPCLPPTECREVTDCSSCGSAVCVRHEPQIPTTGCVTPASSCSKGNYCECLDACPTSGFECMEADDGVHCPCPVC